MKVFLIILFLLTPFLKSVGQNKIGIEGSYFIAAFATDGIIVATDSRGNFYDSKDSTHKPLAYFDKVQKLFIVGNYAIAETGNALYSDYFLCRIIEQYKKENPKLPVLSKLLSSLMFFAETKMDKESFQVFKQNKLLAIGYEKSDPLICFYDGENKNCIINGYVQSDTSSFKKLYSSSYDSKKLAKIANNSIREYVKTTNKNDIIGGDISIVKIKKDGIEWIQNEPECVWNTIQDFLYMFKYKPKQVNITFTSKENEKKLLNLFKENYPDIFK